MKKSGHYCDEISQIVVLVNCVQKATKNGQLNFAQTYVWMLLSRRVDWITVTNKLSCIMNKEFWFWFFFFWTVKRVNHHPSCSHNPFMCSAHASEEMKNQFVESGQRTKTTTKTRSTGQMRHHGVVSVALLIHPSSITLGQRVLSSLRAACQLSETANILRTLILGFTNYLPACSWRILRPPPVVSFP